MAAPDEERFEAMAEEIVRLKRSNADLESRVRALEVQVPPPLASFAPPPLPSEAAPALTGGAGFAGPRGDSVTPVISAPPGSVAPVVSAPPVPAPPVRAGADAVVPMETRLGLNWVNRVAVFTLMIGAAFLFKYGVDNNWIGPGARVLLGVACAIAALVIGHRMYRQGQRVYAQGITGLGIALLYLSFWAAASFYELIPHALAFVLMAATTAGAGWLALLYESQAIAVLGMLGGYLTPSALSTGEDHPWILFGYVFLLNAGALAVARLRPWQGLE